MSTGDVKKFKEFSREKLVKVMRTAVTKMMEHSLDYAHVACPAETFSQLRSKILRSGNDCMRHLEKEFQAYDVEYLNMVEEVIEFNKR